MVACTAARCRKTTAPTPSTRSSQDLGRDEELAHHHQAQEDAPPDGAAGSTGGDLVDQQEADRGQYAERQVQVPESLTDLVRGEAVAQSGRRRRPPPAG